MAKPKFQLVCGQVAEHGAMEILQWHENTFARCADAAATVEDHLIVQEGPQRQASAHARHRKNSSLVFSMFGSIAIRHFVGQRLRICWSSVLRVAGFEMPNVGSIKSIVLPCGYLQ
jgi:hypothetical protein